MIPATTIARVARWRVPLGFVSAALVIWLAAPTVLLVTCGACVAFIGEGIRVWAAGHLNKSREVTRSGPYRYMAHPLYVGSMTMGVGVAIASGSVAAAVVIVVYLGVTISAAISSEEAFLRRKFGSDYERYRRGETTIDAHADRPFSVAQAMANREYRALIGLVLAVLLLLFRATL